MESFENKNTPYPPDENRNIQKQRFKLSTLEMLFGSLIVLGLIYVGYFILSQDTSGSLPKLEKRLKLMEIKSTEQTGKIENQLKAIQDRQIQLESRLKGLETSQRQLETGYRELLAKLEKTPRRAVEEKKSSLPRGKIQYKVRPGETLFSIARKFKVSRDDLARWNKMDKNKSVRAGEILMIYP
jgi:peptidoglycan lytic transglycosylase D